MVTINKIWILVRILDNREYLQNLFTIIKQFWWKKLNQQQQQQQQQKTEIHEPFCAQFWPNLQYEIHLEDQIR